jgi:glutathione S-transferase
MKLYYAPQTRATRPRWLLEEIGAPYELVRLDLSKGEHKKPDYLEIHPHGVVPALVDGELALYESSAICMYIADRFPDKKMAPPPGSPDRGRYYQWMVYAMATLEPPVAQYAVHTRFAPEEKRIPHLAEEGKAKALEATAVLERALTGRQFLFGDELSAADVMIGSLLIWADRLGLASERPALQGYIARLKERPAFKRAQS